MQAMNKNYLFYLIQNIKSIFLIGEVFFGLLIFSGLWGNDFKLSFLGVIDFIFGMVGGGFIVMLWFLIPVILSTLFRWVFQNQLAVSVILTFIVFYTYGYFSLFNSSERVGSFWYLVIPTIMFIGLSEWFIYKSSVHSLGENVTPRSN